MAMITLSQKEKLYYSLTFLQQKAWFGRHETLQNSYGNLKDTLVNIQKHEHRDSNPKEVIEDVATTVDTVCLQLADFCSVRIECINFYIHISKNISTSSLNDLLIKVENIIDSISSQLGGVLLSPLKDCIVEELNILTYLLKTAQAISEWSYIDAMCFMQKISFLFAKWKPLLLKNQNSSTFRSGLFGFGEKVSSNPTSALFNWFEKFFHFLLAKFTFYFYEGLSQDSTAEEMKSYTGKCSYDFILKCNNFIKRNDATNILLLLNVCDNKRSSPPTHGYNLPDSTAISSGDEIITKGFFPILCLPQAGNIDVTGIIELLQHKASELQSDKVVHLQSPTTKMSLFCLLMEPRIYVVIYYAARKNEKEGAPSVFLTEINQHIQLKRIGSLLKPGTK